jgi:hypothetical protein
MKISEVLIANYADKIWTITGDDYETLEWSDESPKPTKAKLESEWASLETQLAAKAQAMLQAKASAISKLQALGLTLDEVEAAFGLTE